MSYCLSEVHYEKEEERRKDKNGFLGRCLSCLPRTRRYVWRYYSDGLSCVSLSVALVAVWQVFKPWQAIAKIPKFLGHPQIELPRKYRYMYTGGLAVLSQDRACSPFSDIHVHVWLLAADWLQKYEGDMYEAVDAKWARSILHIRTCSIWTSYVYNVLEFSVEQVWHQNIWKSAGLVEAGTTCR